MTLQSVQSANAAIQRPSLTEHRFGASIRRIDSNIVDPLRSLIREGIRCPARTASGRSATKHVDSESAIATLPLGIGSLARMIFLRTQFSGRKNFLRTENFASTAKFTAIFGTSADGRPRVFRGGHEVQGPLLAHHLRPGLGRLKQPMAESSKSYTTGSVDGVGNRRQSTSAQRLTLSFRVALRSPPPHTMKRTEDPKNET
ncbi:hypothetical protein CKO51_23585 [Rhodopirellula sp. SM50]|nr:hypothetical protein CKO51_23585 [Rhodopirellula sp. SM50]